MGVAGFEAATSRVGSGDPGEDISRIINPGLWMAHCHIAEHHESGMMFSFEVLPAGD